MLSRVLHPNRSLLRSYSKDLPVTRFWQKLFTKEAVLSPESTQKYTKKAYVRSMECLKLREYRGEKGFIKGCLCIDDELSD